jgi:hypothetical protein
VILSKTITETDDTRGEKNMRELEGQLKLGQAAAQHASKMFVRADAERRAWREEWQKIAENNQRIREDLRPKLELAPPVRFEIESCEPVEMRKTA